MPRSLLRIALVSGLAVFAACGGSGGSDDPSSSADSSSDSSSASSTGEEVSIRLVAFDPEELTVDAGTTVTWTNDDPGGHTVTSGEVEEGTSSVTPAPDGLFDSGDIAGGETFEQTFDEPGTYAYFCAVHPATMRGVITVR